MFWGLKLETAKDCKPISNSNFRITSAALDTRSSGNEPVQVFVKTNDTIYILCTLTKENIPQAFLDLQFEGIEDVSFFKSGGKGTVYLTGYEIEDDDDLADFGEEEEECDIEESEEPPALIPIKRKKELEDSPIKTSKKARLSLGAKENKITESPKSLKKNQKVETNQKKNEAQNSKKNGKDHDLSLSYLRNGDLEEESDDSDFELDESKLEDTTADMDDSAMLGEEDDDDDDDDEDMDDEEEEVDDDAEEEDLDDSDEELDEEQEDEEDEDEEESEEEVKIPVKPTPESKKSKAKSQNTPLAPTTINDKTPSKKFEKKEKANTPMSQSKNNKENYKHPDTPMPANTPSKPETPASQRKKRVLAGGVSCEDLVLGSGAEAKSGSSVYVYYEGRLRKSGKVFDKNVSGAPFHFKLGKNEVIKGWDVGVEGMKIGGKRRMVIPPHMAYGKRGSPPEIPPHAALVFEVELKDVKK